MNGLFIGGRASHEEWWPIQPDPVDDPTSPHRPIAITPEEAVKWYYRVNAWTHTLSISVRQRASDSPFNEPDQTWFRYATVIAIGSTLTGRGDGVHSVSDESDLVRPAWVDGSGGDDISASVESAIGEDQATTYFTDSVGGSYLAAHSMFKANPMVQIDEGFATVRPQFNISGQIEAAASGPDVDAQTGFYFSTSPLTFPDSEGYVNGGLSGVWTMDGVSRDLYLRYWGDDTLEEVAITLTSEIISYNAWGGRRDVVSGALI